MATALTPAARRVLDAAALLFYEQGIHAVGVEAIAAAAGVTKKTLYDRFGSKDALVAAYLRERDERWRRRIERHLERVPPQERPLAVFDALAGWLAEESSRGCAFVNAHAELTSAEARGRAVVREQKAWMAALLERLVAEAGARDVRPLAAQLFMLLEGATVAYAVAGDTEAPRTARAAAAALLAAA